MSTMQAINISGVDTFFVCHHRHNVNTGATFECDRYPVGVDSPVGVMLRHAVSVTFTTASGTTETYCRPDVCLFADDECFGDVVGGKCQRHEGE